MAEAAARLEDDHLTLKEWPASERPTERLLQHGPSQLSNAELLAVLLRSGTEGQTVLAMAERLLASFGGVSGLRKASLNELGHVRGIGPVKAAQISALLELANRMLLAEEQPLRINSPADAAGMLMLQMADLPQEQLRLVLVNSRNVVLGWPVVFTGGLRLTMVRLGDLFREPIRHGASAFIMAHNHPSGDPTPSPEDVKLTHETYVTGKLLDIELLDHIVIGQGRWVSLRSLGLGFESK